ncbi:MAG: hypothetical protein IT200_11990 [Thermoleophilia bacterium]|nr:hypothetical protein [Thermoleophilia bacterium]
MHRIPRRTRAAAAAAMAVAGLACITAGIAPGTVLTGVRAAHATAQWSAGPAAVAAGISPLLLAARVVARTAG